MTYFIKYNMVIYISSSQNHLDIITEGANRVIECIFDDLHNESVDGGAISVSNDECHFYCLDSFFHDCSARSSGGIHILNSQNIICSKICAILCSSKQSYSFFSRLESSTNLICSLFSMHFCSGYASTVRFKSKEITVSNINSTHNEGYQEPGFLLAYFENAFLRYADSISNLADYIGINTYTGTNSANLKNVHYENVTMNMAKANHVYFHNLNNTTMSDSYINIDPNDAGYSLSLVNADVKFTNIYLIGLMNFQNINNNNEEGIIKAFIETKTLHYSFLNNLNCPANIDKCLTYKPKNNNIIYLYKFNLICLIIFH